MVSTKFFFPKSPPPKKKSDKRSISKGMMKSWPQRLRFRPHFLMMAALIEPIQHVNEGESSRKWTRTHRATSSTKFIFQKKPNRVEVRYKCHKPAAKPLEPPRPLSRLEIQMIMTIIFNMAVNQCAIGAILFWRFLFFLPVTLRGRFKGDRPLICASL